MLWILFGTFFFLLILNMLIAFALGIAAVVTMLKRSSIADI